MKWNLPLLEVYKNQKQNVSRTLKPRRGSIFIFCQSNESELPEHNNANWIYYDIDDDIYYLYLLVNIQLN